MPEYTVLAVLAVLAVVALERFRYRTGLFRTATFRLTMAVTLFFMVLVDGWLTKESAPIVLYDDAENSGLRIPWDIPVEDYLFGFALLTWVLLRWVRLGDDHEVADDQGDVAVERDDQADAGADGIQRTNPVVAP